MTRNEITDGLIKEATKARRAPIQKKIKAAQAKMKTAHTLIEQAKATLLWAERENGAPSLSESLQKLGSAKTDSDTLSALKILCQPTRNFRK